MLALTWYEWFLAGHVLAAVVWVGGALTLVILGLLIQREGDPVQLAQFGRQAGLIGERLFTPLSVLIFLFAVGLMENGRSPWEWDMTWISLSLLGWLVAFLVGSIWLRSRAGKLRQVMQTEGPGGPNAQAMMRSMLLTSRLTTLLLLAVVVVMAAKPGM